MEEKIVAKEAAWAQVIACHDSDPVVPPPDAAAAYSSVTGSYGSAAFAACSELDVAVDGVAVPMYVLKMRASTRKMIVKHMHAKSPRILFRILFFFFGLF